MFKHYYSRKWHTNLSNCMFIKCQNPSNEFTAKDQECKNFSLSEILVLQKYTDEYLTNKKVVKQDKIDDLLLKLIRCSKYYIHAIFACAHRLSKPKLRDLHKTVIIHVKTLEEYKNYIVMVLLNSNFNPEFLSEDEILKAKAILKALCSADDDKNRAAIIPALLQRGVDDTILKDPGTLLTTLVSQLWNSTKYQLPPMGLFFERWNEAVHVVAWMKGILEYSEVNIDLSLMDTEFEDWRAWACWAPDIKRIEFIAQQTKYHSRVKDLIILEGPDWSQFKHQKLLDSFISQNHSDDGDNESNWFKVGDLQLNADTFQGTMSEMVEEAFLLFEKATQISPEAVNLFISTVITKVAVVDKTFQNLNDIFGFKTIPTTLLYGFETILTGNGQADIALLSQIADLLQSSTLQRLRSNINPLLGIAIRKRMLASIKTIYDSFLLNESAPQISLDDLEEMKKMIQKHDSLRVHIDSYWLLKFEQFTFGHLGNLCAINKMISTFNNEFQCLKLILHDYAKNVLDQWISPDAKKTEFIKVLLEEWGNCSSPAKQNLVLRSVELMYTKLTLCSKLVESIANHLESDQAKEILDLIEKPSEESCVKLTTLLSSLKESQVPKDFKQAWAEVLGTIIFRFQSRVVQSASLRLNVGEWVQWHSDIYDLLNFDPYMTIRHPRELFSEDTQKTIETFRTIPKEELEILDMILEPCKGISQILLCDESRIEKVVKLLRLLATTAKIELKGFYNYLFSRLTLVTEAQISVLFVIIKGLATASPSEIDMCISLSKVKQKSSNMAVAGIAFGYFNKFGKIPKNLDSVSVKSFSGGLFLTTTVGYDKIEKSLDCANSYLKKEYQDLNAKVERIEAIKRALKIHDYQRTIKYLGTLGIQDKDPLFLVPTHLIDVVEEISFHQYEILFPLDSLRPLARLALDVETVKNVIVHIDFTHGMLLPTFCVHLDPAPLGNEQSKHTYWNPNVQKISPDEPSCRSTKINSLTFHIYRAIRRIVLTGVFDIEKLYAAVTTTIASLFKSCYVCGSGLSVRTYLPRLCAASKCRNLSLPSAAHMGLTVQSMEVTVQDLLVTAVYNAAKAGKMEYLPSVPFKGTHIGLAAVINSMPSLEGAAKRWLSHGTLDGYVGPQGSNLIYWINRFPAFITEAGGVLRIPSLPKVMQFVVGSCSEAVDVARLKHFGKDRRSQVSTQVVFHGTTMDRLFPILYEGLKVCSGTSLQRTGASYGNGVYVSKEPSTAFSYAKKSLTWNASRMPEMMVVLGLEVAGPIREPSTGINVVADADQLALRYIFLVPPGMRAPLANHIVPAMQSAYALMRDGLA